MKNLIIVGASGHGKVAADIARNNGYSEILFLDDDPSKKACGRYPVVGTVSDAEKYDKSDFFVGIGNGRNRREIQNTLLKKHLSVVSLIHPSAVIAQDVEIGCGSVVMAGAVINTGTKIGSGCIINTCASVDHDNRIADFVHVSVGAHLAGTVIVGQNTWIGIGAVISNDLEICDECVIGAGAVVVKNIEEAGTYVGVPARKIR